MSIQHGEVIIFPDVEAMAVTYLKDVLDDTYVATKIPAQRPNRMVKVTRVGGIRRDLIADSPMVTFECWDASSADASELCLLTRAYIAALAGYSVNGTWVYGVSEVGGPAYFPDPNTDLPRYQFTVAIDVRGGSQ